MTTVQGHEPDHSSRAHRKAVFPLWLLPLGALACLAGFVGFTDSGAAIAREALEAVGLRRSNELDAAESRATQETSGAWAASAKQPWDGMVHLTASQRDTLGVKMAAVASQSEPVRMEIQGKTDYNPDTIIKVRPRFDALVLAVHATVGQKVEKGDPLVELYSVQLAEAKLAYESKQSQAMHDRQIASQQRDLVAQGVLPPTSRTLLDAENNQRRSDLEYKLARDTLVVYGVSLEDIDKVAEEDGAEKAKMTLCAQGGGTIIGRDVAVGNIYDVNDTLFTISALDELWVLGQVYERDLASITEGLKWEVQFPFTKEVVEGQVEYVSNQVDPDTHAVRIRGSIPNQHGRYKSDQLVRIVVFEPPVAGHVVIPRSAIVVCEDDHVVFVKKDNTNDAFERRPVKTAHELRDSSVVSGGLTAGEQIVINGGILLQQLYEDSKP